MCLSVVGKIRLRSIEIGARLFHARPVGTIVHAHEHVAGSDLRVVVDLDSEDIAADLRGDHSRAPADVSVVGLLHSASEWRQLPRRKQDEHYNDGEQDHGRYHPRTKRRWTPHRGRSRYGGGAAWWFTHAGPCAVPCWRRAAETNAGHPT